MSRWTSSANESGAAEQSISMVTMADLDLPTEHLRVHDGAGTLSWGGNDWLGVGAYGGVDVVAESFDVIATPVKMTLSGVDPALITEAMTTAYHGRTGSLYVGLLDTRTNQFIDTPELVWEGAMDYMEIEFAEGQATITLNCEHRLRRKPATSRYTDEDQQARHTGDTFFQWVYKIANSRAKWGAQPVGGGGGAPVYPENPGDNREAY